MCPLTRRDLRAVFKEMAARVGSSSVPSGWLGILVALLCVVVLFLGVMWCSFQLNERTSNDFARRKSFVSVRHYLTDGELDWRRTLLFSSSDAVSVDVEAQRVVFSGNVSYDAKAVAIVGHASNEARSLRLRIQGDGPDDRGSHERTIKFPSRKALTMFRDGLHLAKNGQAERAKSNLSVLVSTWNVGNSPPPTDLSRWLVDAKGADIVVVGTQECTFSASSVSPTSETVSVDSVSPVRQREMDKHPRDPESIRVKTKRSRADSPSSGSSSDESESDKLDIVETNAENSKRLAGKRRTASPLRSVSDPSRTVSWPVKGSWQDTLRSNLSTMDFTAVAEVFSWDRCLSIYAKSTIATDIHSIRTDTAFVGLGGVAGNKGAIGVRLSVYDTEFLFVNSHLAAHQGNVQRRNEGFSSIAGSMRALKDHHLLDVLNGIVHHTFWLGDLNYRVDLPVEHATELALRGEYEKLLEKDQLHLARSSGKAFDGFEEATISFPPTYQYERGKNEYSTKKMRVPSYTDRILWKSLPGLTTTARSYTSVESIQTSDHRPVVGVFDVSLVHTAGLSCLLQSPNLWQTDGGRGRTPVQFPDDLRRGQSASRPTARNHRGLSVPRQIGLGNRSRSSSLIAGVIARSVSSLAVPRTGELVKTGEDAEQYVIEFSSLSARHLPEMDGEAQVAVSMIASALSSPRSRRTARANRVDKESESLQSDASQVCGPGLRDSKLSIGGSGSLDEASRGNVGRGVSCDSAAGSVWSIGNSGASMDSLDGVAEERGLCDPYCVFHGPAVAELAEGSYMTDVIRKTQNPDWACTGGSRRARRTRGGRVVVAGGGRHGVGISQVPVVHLHDDEADAVRRKYVSVTVMDEDIGSAHDVVGSSVLWLGAGWLDTPEPQLDCTLRERERVVVARTTFEEKIMGKGVSQGVLRGSYQIVRIT